MPTMKQLQDEDWIESHAPPESRAKYRLQGLIAKTESRVRVSLVGVSVKKLQLGANPSHVIEDAIDVILDELVVQLEMET